MATIDALKEQQTPPTPLFLFDCVLSSGATVRWSTHAVTFSGNAYNARLLKHNLFELRANSEDGLGGSAKITVMLANADSFFSEIERETGFKGAQVTITFVFFDLVTGTAASNSRVVFLGTANPPQEITESAFTVTFNNRLNLQRIVLPEVQILRRCPWMFPSTLAQRTEALSGGAAGQYSALYRCGYSADVSGGVGNLNSGTAYTSCDFTRSDCVARGMFSQDSSANATARFGGLEFVPPQIQVRAFGQSATTLSPEIDNIALYNDPVPLVYGTAWYAPPIVFARNDGNLTRMEVLLGMGQIDSVITVIVNGIEIPQGVSGVNMTGTGWYNVITPGTRNGAFDPNFTDASGNPLGDPYGSMAMMSVVVPNVISNGSTLPTIQVLINGLLLEQFNSEGTSLGQSFSNSPVWVLLDVLRRSGWLTTEINLPSFAAAAATCATAISTTDLNGNAVSASLFECNVVIQDSYSGAELANGIKRGASMILTYDDAGLLELLVENTIALQQPALPDGSNSTEMLDGGWPAYEFSDGSATFSGIARKANGDPTVRLWAQLTASTPNQLTIEFQDEFNDYQQDSLSLVDVDDALLTQRLVTAAYPALGIPNFDQATRILQLALNKSIGGYQFIDFETTVKGITISPGDLITVTYLKEGLERQPFRVVKMSPGWNYQTVQITAQWHDDSWYSSTGAAGTGTRMQPTPGTGIPRPLVGAVIDSNGIDQFGITETTVESTDGSFVVELTVSFTPPAAPVNTGVSIPLVSLEASISTTGGSITGGQSVYYAVSALDGSGSESALSFSIPATIPAGTNTNEVTLSGLSFASATAGFNVYRGPNPQELLLIAGNVTVASSYTDTGATAELIGPPDANYDHANFYWREELQPEIVANIVSANTIGNSTLGMLTDDFAGATVRITRGRGATQEVAVTSNTTTTLTVSPAWEVTPDTTSYFVVADSTWNFAGFSATSPIEVEVPNQTGLTVEVSGRSANALNQESAESLNPVTRWQIGGASGGGVDTGVPAQPTFALNLPGQGTVELAGISFTDLTNTHTVYAGMLTLYYWNELDSPSSVVLASAVSASATSITLGSAGTATAGSLIQIDGEILTVTAVSGGGITYMVTRGSQGSTAAAHSAGAVVYQMSTNVTIMPFVGDFFGSPASGSYSLSIFLPDVRIGAAGFFVTNVRGNSPAAAVSYGSTTDEGLRTLSGGQLSIQVEGYLAVQTDAAPPLVVEDTLAIRDIFAVVGQAPSDPLDSAPVQMQLRQGSTVFATLTIAAGATESNVIDGFGMAPLTAASQISLDILSVPSAAGSLPGSDLTVVIRL
jgi:Putative phage tail protein